MIVMTLDGKYVKLDRPTLILKSYPPNFSIGFMVGL